MFNNFCERKNKNPGHKRCLLSFSLFLLPPRNRRRTNHPYPPTSLRTTTAARRQHAATSSADEFRSLVGTKSVQNVIATHNVVLMKIFRQWHDAPGHEGFLSRYGTFFVTFCPHVLWYSAVDICLALHMSVPCLVSLKAQSTTHCIINGVCYSFLLFSINVVTILKLHPHRAPRSVYVCAASASMEIIAVISSLVTSNYLTDYTSVPHFFLIASVGLCAIGSVLEVGIFFICDG